MNYLQLVNRVLSDLNEVEISDVTSTRGIQTTAKNAVDSAIRDIVNAEVEWPFLHSATTQTMTIGENEYDLTSGYTSIDWENIVLRPVDLVSNGDFTTDLTGWSDVSSGTGAIAHSANGDGRMEITGDGTNPGAGEQSVSTVVGKDYHVTLRFFSNDVDVYIGTTSGGSEVTSETLTLDNEGQGFEGRVTFTATATTTYIGFYNTSTTAVEVDQVSVRRDVKPRELKYVSYDEYVRKYRDNVEYNTTLGYDIPVYVYRTRDDQLGVYPVPDEEYEVTYEYWTAETDMTANTDEPNIPARYHDVIISGGKAYVLETRSDPVFRDRMFRRFSDGINRMRTDLIDHPDYMKAV